MLYRVATTNVVPKRNILEIADFRKSHVAFTMRNGKTYTFNYADCVVTNSIFGNIETVTLKIKSQNPKQNIKIHLLYPKELSEQEVEEIKTRLKVGKRLLA